MTSRQHEHHGERFQVPYPAAAGSDRLWGAVGGIAVGAVMAAALLFPGRSPATVPAPDALQVAMAATGPCARQEMNRLSGSSGCRRDR